MGFRSLLFPASVAAAFGGTVAWILLTEPPAVPDPVAESRALAQTPAAGPKPVAITPPPDSSKPAGTAPLPDAIRDVSPDGVSAPQVVGSLTRIAPSDRYLELKNPPVQPIPDGPLELKRIEVLDAGHLRSDRLTVKLAYVSPPPLDETCKTQLGGSWPCGVRARTFLRGLIRRLKVTCEKVEDLGPQKILATCARGTIDLSTRLVQYGWSGVSEDAPDTLKTLAAEAQAEKIGLWQADWITDLPTPDWANQDLSDLPDLEELSPEIIDWSLRSEGQDPATGDPFTDPLENFGLPAPENQ